MEGGAATLSDLAEGVVDVGDLIFNLRVVVIFGGTTLGNLDFVGVAAGEG